MLLAPAYLAFDSFLSMNAFEPLIWLLCAWIAIRIVKGADPRWWLAFGVIAGIGLQNKHTMLVFGFALVAGLADFGPRSTVGVEMDLDRGRFGFRDISAESDVGSAARLAANRSGAKWAGL